MTPRAKKRFGQHFLRDSGILDRIVRLIHPQADDLVVEIGAGDGALTKRLAPAVPQLLAIEIDLDCIPALRAALQPFPSAAICQGDILHLDLSMLLSPHLHPSRRLRFAGNLPFNISTVIIEKLMESALPIGDMTFMVQLEVAERIAAPPGSRDYGYLSVFCQHRADVRIAFKVSPACFVPRPKVSAAVITLRPKAQLFDPTQERDFKQLVKAAFAYRRKTLVNSLRRDRVWGEMANALLSRAGIEGGLRPEALSVDAFERLALAPSLLGRVSGPAQGRKPGQRG